MRKLNVLLFLLIFLVTSCQTSTPTPDLVVVETLPPLPPTLTPVPPPIPVGQRGSWDLLFSDEFNGSALDTTKWTTCYWWADNGCTIGVNNEMEWYQPENVLVADGILRLRAQRQKVIASDGKTYAYTSGMISSGRMSYDLSSRAGFAFEYGYAEIKARLPHGKGLWPAFWMLPNNNQSKPEIDVLEVLGDDTSTIYMTFHFLTADGSRGRSQTVWQGPDFSNDWHTFAIDWQPHALTWYVDGIERSRFTDLLYIPDEPMYLLINLAVGGDWPGKPESDTVFPAYFDVDYVRVWRR